MEDIDYTSKIQKFQNLTDNYNEEEALNYLQDNDWDEKVFSHYYYYLREQQSYIYSLKAKKAEN